jgi:hypothetical protein
MSDIVLFQMCSWRRKDLIEGHRFYVDQARKRLLSQFENIETEAEQASEEWLERSGSRFDPDLHDPCDFYGAANNAGIEFYGLLSNMRDQTHLGMVAGMFHEWDKQLRDWLVHETQHWYVGENFPRCIWEVNFHELGAFLESLGWDVGTTAYWKILNACRLVVNVYKHGTGGALDQLKEKHPEYLHDPTSGHDTLFSSVDFRDHTYLRISEAQIEVFSEAIITFWSSAPENIWYNQVKDVTGRIQKAILKDQANKKTISKK